MSLTIQEFRRLVKLNFWCREDEKLERHELRLKYGKFLLNLALTPMGWITAVLLLVVCLIPPFHVAALYIAAFSLIHFCFIIPSSIKRLNNIRDGWFLLVLRAILIIISMFLSVLQILMAKQADEDMEMKRIAALSPEERYMFDLETKEKADRKMKEDNEKNKLEINSIIEAESKLLIENKRKVDEAVKQKETKTHNKEQESFYDTLGAPKILYKCKGNELVWAIGATFGSVNQLIKEGENRCSESGIDIINRKD